MKKRLHPSLITVGVLLLSSLLWLPLSVNSQSFHLPAASGTPITSIAGPLDEQLSVRDLKLDFELFRQGMEKAHAGLYTYHDMGSFKLLFDEAESQLNSPMTIREFYVVLSQLVAAIRDGHTAVSLRRPVGNFYAKEALLFPFSIYFIDEDAYIYKNVSQDTSIQVGWQVYAINGVSMETIVARIFNTLPADGGNRAGKFRNLNKALFLLNYWRIYGSQESFDLELGTSDNRLIKKTVQGEVLDSLNSRARRLYPAPPERPNLDLIPISEDLTFLSLKSFANRKYRGKQQRLRPAIRKAFKQIKKSGVQNLVLDLRNNAGGYVRHSYYLTRFLIDQKIKREKELSARIKKTELNNGVDPPVKVKNFTGPAGFFYNWQYIKNPEGEGYIRRKLPVNKPARKWRFEGKLYVLIGRGSFSAGSDLAGALRTFTDATLVGLETGGGYYSNAAGYMSWVTLPHSKIMFSIPLIRQVHAVKYDIPKGRGVLPHEVVIPSIAQILAGEDADLEKVKQLIREKGGK